MEFLKNGIEVGVKTVSPSVKLHIITIFATLVMKYAISELFQQTYVFN